jgi:hypothetical protein
MQELRNARSIETPHACARGKHFYSKPVLECSACEIERQNKEFPCRTGRHFSHSRQVAGLSECCTPFLVPDVQVLTEKKRSEEGRLPSLEGRVEQIKVNIQKFNDLKSDLTTQIASMKAARSDTLSRGERPPDDVGLINAQNDLPAVETHLARENAALVEANSAVHSCRNTIALFDRQLDMAAKYGRRDEIHARMAELFKQWNELVLEILGLREECGLKPEDGGMNGPGHFPIFPPGIVAAAIQDEPFAPLHFLRPVDLTPKGIDELKNKKGAH